MPRIQSELALLGYAVADNTVSKYMVQHRQPQTWRTFLDNHVPDLVAVDFFTFRRQLFECSSPSLFFTTIVAGSSNVTLHPTAQWTAQQIVEAFPFDDAPRYLIRDRDGTYGSHFRRKVKALGIDLSLDRNSPAPREVESPCQGPVTAIPQIGSLHYRYARAA